MRVGKKTPASHRRGLVKQYKNYRMFVDGSDLVRGRNFYDMLVIILFCLWTRAYATGEKSHVSNGSSLEGKWLFFVNQDHTKMVSVVTDSTEQVYRDCYTSGDTIVIKTLMDAVPDANVTEVDTDSVRRLIDLCIDAKWRGNFTVAEDEAVVEGFGLVSSFFIYPGTKWCGAGNVSGGYDDLGPESEADACCREHDHCDDIIEAYSSNHGLKNSAPFTKSNCECDNKFYDCLQEADTRAAARIGRIFFNIIQMQCFREDFPVKGCKKYHGRFRRTCQEYEYDTNEDPIWQWFDPKHFEPRPDEEDNEIEGAEGNVFQNMLQLANAGRPLSPNPNKDS